MFSPISNYVHGLIQPAEGVEAGTGQDIAVGGSYYSNYIFKYKQTVLVNSTKLGEKLCK